MVTSTRSFMPGGRLRGTAAAALLLVASCGASALTLGRVQGAVWLGQPLDVHATLQLDAGQAPDALCLSADVFHGDAKQDANRVQVSVEADKQQPQALRVRIRSASLVDEPVVMVYLKETCLSKTSRRYVLLSEILPDAAGPDAVPVVPAAAASAPAAPARQASAALPAARPRVVRRQAAGDTARPPAAHARAPVAAAAPAHQGRPARGDASTHKAQAKLKLDPVETLSERVAQLEASAAVGAAQPPAGAQDAQRLQKLEQNLQNLLALSARNERSLSELRQQLRQAEEDKYANPLVYGLAAILLAALGALAYLWRRQRQAAAASGWWDDASGGARAMSEVEPVVAAAAAQTELRPASVFAAPQPREQARAQTAPVEESEIDLDNLLVPPAAAADPVGVSPPAEETPFPALGAAARAEATQEAPPPDAAPLMPEFPAAGEVTIDVSHLSLSDDEPAAPATPAAPAPTPSSEPLLHFELPVRSPADTGNGGSSSKS